MGAIPDVKLETVKRLYYKKKMSMREVAEELKVSHHAVVYFMRRHGLNRRNFFETNMIRFEKKPPSFRMRRRLSKIVQELKVAGVMLYWGEGYKGEKSDFVDFANSDPIMIQMFLNFLRTSFELSKRKFRVLLYCYADQDSDKLIDFWSSLTRIPKSQFIKPYVRKDFRKDGRKMIHGLIHVRYIDKKLLLTIKNLIIYYQKKFAQVVP